jgi:DNA-binding response OmpR family regulator
MIPASYAKLRAASSKSCLFRSSKPKTVSTHWSSASALGHLRRMPGGDTPKVVFCTTETSIDHISRAIDGGANEYIMKPFDKGIVAAKFAEVGLIELMEPTA